MAERSKALRSGRSPLLWAWVRIPLLTTILLFETHSPSLFYKQDWSESNSRVAQWKRAGPITQRSVDRNYALLTFFVASGVIHWFIRPRVDEMSLGNNIVWNYL